MNIIGILCITLAINSWGKAMFDLDTYPAWANATGVWGRSGCRTWSMHALPTPSPSPTGTRRRQQVGATTRDVWATCRGPTVPRRVPRGSSEPPRERQWSPTREGRKAVIFIYFFNLHCTIEKNTAKHFNSLIIFLYQAHEEQFSDESAAEPSRAARSQHSVNVFYYDDSG